MPRFIRGSFLVFRNNDFTVCDILASGQKFFVLPRRIGYTGIPFRFGTARAGDVTALDGPTDAAAPSLCYLLATLAPSHLYTTRQNDDYAYLIHEYIEQNYHRPLRLADLASALHLSERQTQRIVRRLFGVSFSSLLASHRASVAERLATTDMSWAEIAEYVGYETYSGFRRAFLRHSGDK